MLEHWQEKALEHFLLDYQAWADHAVSEKIFKTIDEALTSKARKCAERMIKSYESIHGEIPEFGTEEKIQICISDEGSMTRAEREESMQ